MAISTSRKIVMLHVLAAILLCPSALVEASKNRLRGVQPNTEQQDTASTSNTAPHTYHKGNQQRRHHTRQLYGTEFDHRFDVLTSHARRGIPLDYTTSTVGNDTDETSSAGGNDGTSSLLGQPVYFEKQSDDPNDSDPKLRIVGGTDSLEQRNFCMHLQWDDSNQQYLFAGCGGALISNCHVLTAAHCSSDSREGLPDGLYCNAYNPFEGNYGNDFHFSPLRRAMLHPNFDNFSNKNDVAVLELETCVDDMSSFPIMNVADPEFLSRLRPNDDVVVSGFGRLSESNSAQVDHLQQVDVPYIPGPACNDFYPGRIYDDMLCAGTTEGGVDACQGDSGGALFHQGPGGDRNQTAIGVVSWGTGCAQASKPGVYSNVAYHHPWIQEKVCSDSRVDSTIALCSTPAPTAAPTKAPTPQPTPSPIPDDSSRETCSGIHDSCDLLPCCGILQCKTRSIGAAPTCSTPPSNNRNPLGVGRGGAGGAFKGEMP